MSEAIYLSNVRLSFPKLVEAEAPSGTPNAAKKFGADLLLDPSDPQLARFMGEVGKLATEKWKENAGTILQMCQNERKNRCFGMGTEKIDKKTLKPYVGYENTTYISASSNEDRPPQMVRGDGQPVDNLNTLERQQLARKLYGGCYVNVAIRPWMQDNQFGRAVRCELIAVQFHKDGEAFGEGNPDVSGMFGAVQQPAPAAAAPGFPGMPNLPWAQ